MSILHDCALGVGVSAASKEVTVEGCYIYGKGMEGSIYEHNTYTASAGMTYRLNRFGPLRAGCLGNNLKDRSAGLVVSANWIEGGNRQLDLVDAEDSAFLRADPRYRETWVCGNVLIEPNGAGNNQIVHYGGDSGKTDWYRKGVLHFINNTVISQRHDATVLVRTATNDEHVDCRNNLVHMAGGGRFALLSSAGFLELHQNWLPTGWLRSLDRLTGQVSVRAEPVVGGKPGFLDEATQDYRLGLGSPCIGMGGALDGVAAEVWAREYVRHQASKARWQGAPDLGALSAAPKRGQKDETGETGEKH